MIPEIGYFSLVLALSLAFLQSFFPLVGAKLRKTSWMQSAYSLTLGQFTFVSIAFICLAYSFLNDDFSVRYVATNSHTLLPAIYQFCAVWGAHEGSMLLWLLFLTAWMVAVLPFFNKMPLSFSARSLSILSLISVGILLFLLLTSNPFERLFSVLLQEGKDLNPLLQDPGLVSHPPMLYAGYVGFAIPFAFAISALMSDPFELKWAHFSRPFTLMAWAFLSIGIVLGSWWAYRQLGWGGWWFWDPVENASFMPWLGGTMLLHSLIVIDRRNTFNAWGILMAIVVFALSLLGTFIVRSGILISVHSFAVDPQRGFFILIFLALVIGGALGIYALYGRKINRGEGFELTSRETFLLLNNIGLLAALMTVLIGTLYPLLAQVLGWGRLSVGAPYFNKTFGALMLPLLFLMGMGPLIHWRQDRIKRIKKTLLVMLFLSIAVGIILPYWITKTFSILASIAVALSVWVFLGLLKTQYAGLRAWGMYLAHGGMTITLLGVILSTLYTQTQDVKMTQGDSFKLSSYEFQLIDSHPIQGSNYKGEEVSIMVYNQKGALLSLLKPQVRFYTVQSMALPKAAIYAGFLRDIYVTLSEPLDHQAWGLRLSVKPFVRWIWIGALLMALGGFMGALQTKSRQR
jgi:cytochrome c-type biogenesis protein CcmF